MREKSIALVRGINVGRAKRIGMADLRELVESLGYTDVATLLNSGNVIFRMPARDVRAAAPRIENALVTRFGIAARVTVIERSDLSVAIANEPFGAVANDPSRYLVSFLREPSDRERLRPLLERDWAPEALALGARVVYLWCPDGVLASRVGDAINRLFGDAVTARNWSTVKKLHALADG